MLTVQQKTLLQSCLAEHTNGLRHAYQLARHQLGKEHMTVRILQRRVETAQETERQLADEPVRQVA
jgi:hypothetical protein